MITKIPTSTPTDFHKGNKNTSNMHQITDDKVTIPITKAKCDIVVVKYFIQVCYPLRSSYSYSQYVLLDKAVKIYTFNCLKIMYILCYLEFLTWKTKMSFKKEWGSWGEIKLYLLNFVIYFINKCFYSSMHTLSLNRCLKAILK